MDQSLTQKRMHELQANEETISDLLGKLVSGRKGYKAVIEKSRIEKCSCGKILSGEEKFCPECGCKIKS